MEQEGLQHGMKAWRLLYAFNRRPEETEADEEHGSGHLTTKLSGCPQRASVDELPGAASELPCDMPARPPADGGNPSSSSSP
jgi:hypothetical protein